MEGLRFHWIPLLALSTWIVACAFMWLKSAKGLVPERRATSLERSRRFARFFSQVPAWHKRNFERILHQPSAAGGRRGNWVLLEREAQRMSIRIGVASPGSRELFVVACLWFFDHPHELREHWPELYDQMSLITGHDPMRAPEVGLSAQVA
jgi:hypothetical protein